MKRSIFAAAVLLLMATAAQAAGPFTKLYSGGWWEVSHGTGNKGSPMCVMTYKVLTNGVKGVHVKWTERNGTFFEVFKSTWRTPIGSTVPMFVTFDHYDSDVQEHTFIATALASRPQLIGSIISEDEVVLFLKRFGDAETMTVVFPAGNEPEWSVPMAGSRNAAGAFERCIAAIRRAAPTQPLLRTAPPQRTRAVLRSPPIWVPPTEEPASPPTSQPASPPTPQPALTDAAIASVIVQASRSQYYATGRPCACPYDTTRNGRCGGRSAYSRPGGASPLCYPSDITREMIERYRQSQASR